MQTTSEANQTVGSRTEHFTFSGKAGKFFEIVFVNYLLKIATLGLYAPWAKVRVLQYLYGHSDLGGAAFQFTADPWRMLLSRVIALVFLIIYTLAYFLSCVFLSYVCQYSKSLHASSVHESKRLIIHSLSMRDFT